jgi:formylglycine-generating enzyme required for sulfatase activity
MPQRFFITHSWHDIEFARRLCDDLLARGLIGFLDEHSMRPGDSIPSRIERGLKECDVYIPIFSPDALTSDWCDWEIDMAITMNRTRKGRPRIIPVIAKPCSVPDRLIHLLYVSFVGRYDEALNELLTKGFGLPPKPPAVSEAPISPAAKTRVSALSRMNWFVPVGTLVGVMLLIVSIIGSIVSGVFAQPTSTPTHVAIVPLTNTPTITSAPPTNTPTATPLPIPTLGIGSTKVSPIDGSPMLYVPAGDFTMGSNDYNDEMPPHIVYLDTFWIDKFEVSNALYRKCVDAGKCSSPAFNKSFSRSSYYGNSQYDNYPVVYVSWNDANAFCSWAGKRLPTEAEWEKAARGTDGRKYPWGNVWDGTGLNFCDRNCPYGFKDKNIDDKYADTSPVGNYPNGASPYGVMDMAGNVWERVVDFYSVDYYRNSPSRNPNNETPGSNRVVRGGSWDNDANKVRVTSRHQVAPSDIGDTYGFRCVE